MENMELEVTNTLEGTTEAVNNASGSSKGKIGKILFGIFGFSAGAFGITRMIRKLKRGKGKKLDVEVKTKEELLEELKAEGYTIISPLEDVE